MKPAMDEAAARAAFDYALANYEQDFGKFFLSRLFGLQIEYVDDTCRIQVDLKDFMFNPQGSLHGGIIAFIMDISMGHLLYRKSGPGTTVEMKTQYVKAARSGRITCTGRFLRHGRGISYMYSEMVDEQGELLAFATSTWKSLKKREEASPPAGARHA